MSVQISDALLSGSAVSQAEAAKLGATLSGTSAEEFSRAAASKLTSTNYAQNARNLAALNSFKKVSKLGAALACVGTAFYTVPFWVPVLFSKKKRDADAKYAALRGDID